ncbi:MAG: 1-deoxy-D-xylulose-5-phosphate reductoisomerase [Candidatus Cloacimonetes bacterium]|jgi:1-deoxy-D-xylulose-5-phosphate reductoisomerase|nr:1-deoxy-D-xylulose-5-phosphate reductoisomerase [Candidatus Cloacimonadota bacterium]
MKKIAILGITGSIGISTIEVIRLHPNDFKIVLATSNNNYSKLFELAVEFNIPELVITNSALQQKITDIPKNSDLTFGENELQRKIESVDSDIVLNAISGSAGLRSSITTISKGADLALANKESLVMAGHKIMKMLEHSNTNLIPVDSEHSAILQAIGNSTPDEVLSIILTASGGPFRDLPMSEFKNITVEETLKHPTWNMGAKITIDSATMMNKGLEIIEAHWLFHKSYDDIKAIIHPQSIVHSFVEFVDGSIVAQLSFPTMQIPILYALTHPHHIKSTIPKTNIIDLPNLNFYELAIERYPLYDIAVNAGMEGGILPTVLNSSNETAIDLFLNKKICFTHISRIVEKQISKFHNFQDPSIEEIIKINKDVYIQTKQDYKSLI